ELNNTRHETISQARSDLHEALKQNYGNLFRNNLWLSGAGLVGAVVATCAILLDYADSYQSIIGPIFAGVFIPLIPIMIGCRLIRTGRHRGGGRGERDLLGGVVVSAAAGGPG